MEKGSPTRTLEETPMRAGQNLPEVEPGNPYEALCIEEFSPGYWQAWQRVTEADKAEEEKQEEAKKEEKTKTEKNKKEHIGVGVELVWGRVA